MEDNRTIDSPICQEDESVTTLNFRPQWILNHNYDFVGRENELQQLIDFCGPLFERRFAGLNQVFGEAGVGKSRLIYQLKKCLRNRVQFIFLQCDNTTQTPLYPFTSWLRQEFSLSSNSEEMTREGLFTYYWRSFLKRFQESMLLESNLKSSQRIVKQLARIEPIIAGLISSGKVTEIGSNPSSSSGLAMIKQAICILFRALCFVKPTALIVEDINSADEDSLAVLSALSREAYEDSFPIAIITTARPMKRTTPVILNLPEGFEPAKIELNGWDATTQRSFVNSILQCPVAEKLQKKIYQLTSGNPFYTQKICLYLKSSGQLVYNGDSCDLPNKQIKLPQKRQISLLTGLEFMDDKVKYVAQTASMLGYVFTKDILRELFKRDSVSTISANELEAVLHLGVKYQVWNNIADSTFCFSHQLLLESFYSMNTEKVIREKHFLVAEILSKIYSNDCSRLGEIASHYFKAGSVKLGVNYKIKAGDYERGIFCYEQSLRSYKEALQHLKRGGEEDQILMAQILHKIGNVSQELGKFEQAVKCQKRAYTLFLKAKGLVDEETALAIAGLGGAYLEMRQIEKALRYLLQVVSIRKEVLGRKHGQTARAIMGVGLAHIRKGEIDKALGYLNEALELFTEVIGRQHVLTASCLGYLASAFVEKFDYQNAHSCFQECLAIQREILGEDHPYTASTLNNMGQMHLNKNEYDLALDFFQQSLIIREEILGTQHPDVAGSCNNIGLTYTRKGDYQKGIEFQKRAISIWTKELGLNNHNVANSLNNLGIIYNDLEEYEEAVNCYLQANRIKVNILGEKHPDTALGYYNLALTYKNRGDLEESLKTAFRAWTLWEEVLGEKHPYTGLALNFMANVYLNMGNKEDPDNNYNQAIKYYKQSHSILSDAVGQDHPWTQMAIGNLILVYDKIGEVEKAEELKSLVIVNK